MARTTDITEMLKIFFKAVKIYFLNLPKFLGYMTFPTLGVFLGIFIIFGTTFGLEEYFLQSKNVPNLLWVMFVLIVATIPGFLILCKAFFDYIIALVALCRAGCDLVATDTLVNDLKSYNSIIEYREIQYTFLILILSLAYTVLFTPFLFILGIVFFIYTSLSIQAFAQDDRLSAFDAIKRSFWVIPGNVFATVGLLTLIGLLTYFLAPMLVVWMFDATETLGYLNKPVLAFLNKLPLEEMLVVPVNLFLANMPVSISINPSEFIQMLSVNLTKCIITTIVTMYLLPVRAIACTLWYNKLNGSSSDSSKYARKLAKRTGED